MERNDVIQVRVSPEEKAEIKARAERNDMTVAEFVRMRVLDPALSFAEVSKQKEFAPVTTIDPVLKEPARLHYCPIYGCDFEAGSAKAVCPIHGRQVE